MAKIESVTCDFCEPGKPAAATIYVDISGRRQNFDCCADCLAGSLGRLSDALRPPEPEAPPEPPPEPEAAP